MLTIQIVAFITNLRMSNEQKKAALETALAAITKQFGEGSVMKMGDHAKIKVETFPSGSIALDDALGGGYAKGRIVEIYGPESS